MNQDNKSSRMGLVLVHNHRHEANIARLDALLGERFSSIQHLVPFYRGSAPNVIRVNDNSQRFQGFFAQGYERLSKAGCAHYVFCGDDLFLHPHLDETNLGPELNLDDRSGFIKYLQPITEAPFAWPHVASALSALASNSGTNWKNELPSEEEAVRLLARHRLQIGTLSWRQFQRGIRPKQITQLLQYAIMHLGRNARPWQAIAHPPYPLIAGYSDFVVVPSCGLADFCHYCGVFAAANVFAELATPTALALSCERIVCEKDTRWKGLELWGDDIASFGASRNYSLQELFGQFGPDQLYVHPIKLSKWH
jgi:hypothetical protein